MVEMKNLSTKNGDSLKKKLFPNIHCMPLKRYEIKCLDTKKKKNFWKKKKKKKKKKK